MNFVQLWQDLEPIGITDRGYRRYSWTRIDAQCRQWFIDQATARCLDVVPDRNGNLWAWWGRPGPGAIVTGSHLDSVPDGGAFDGPLGVVSALAAIDLLRERGVTPTRPIAVVVFVEEEGARFGLACLGSKLLTGAVDPDRARELTDDEGIAYADAFAAAGFDPAGIGPDDELLASIDAFIELHIEQGRALAALSAAPAVPASMSMAPSIPVEPRFLQQSVGANETWDCAPAGAIALAEGIWPHGRWRFDFGGRPDHAGTARFADRNDPLVPFASTVLAARRGAAERGALATFGKVSVEPGAVNGVPRAVRAWLDARAPDEATLRDVLSHVRYECQGVCDEHGVSLEVRQESATAAVRFDGRLRERIGKVLGGPPALPTGAGHDAGVLAARVPTAMLFVRNPTGVSHSPAERAEPADCEAGVRALAAVLEELALT